MSLKCQIIFCDTVMVFYRSLKIGGANRFGSLRYISRSTNEALTVPGKDLL